MAYQRASSSSALGFIYIASSMTSIETETSIANENGTWSGSMEKGFVILLDL